MTRPGNEAVTSYELVYQCFASGQLTGEDLQARMREDEVFRRWVHKRVRRDSH